MSWSRAVWYEPHVKDPYSDAVPSNWIDERGKIVYWPSANVRRLYDAKAQPRNTWKQFRLSHVKYRTNNFEEAAKEGETTEAECDKQLTHPKVHPDFRYHEQERDTSKTQRKSLPLPPNEKRSRKQPTPKKKSKRTDVAVEHNRKVHVAKQLGQAKSFDDASDNSSHSTHNSSFILSPKPTQIFESASVLSASFVCQQRRSRSPQTRQSTPSGPRQMPHSSSKTSKRREDNSNLNLSPQTARRSESVSAPSASFVHRERRSRSPLNHQSSAFDVRQSPNISAQSSMRKDNSNLVLSGQQARTSESVFALSASYVHRNERSRSPLIHRSSPCDVRQPSHAFAKSSTRREENSNFALPPQAARRTESASTQLANLVPREQVSMSPLTRHSSHSPCISTQSSRRRDDSSLDRPQQTVRISESPSTLSGNFVRLEPRSPLTRSPVHQSSFTFAQTPPRRDDSAHYPMSEERFQRRLFQYVLEMRADIKDLKAKRELDQHGISLRPCETREDFLNLETEAQQSQTKREQMMSLFKSKGGVDLRDNVNNIIIAIFSPQLLGNVSLKGKKLGKIAFLGTQVAYLVIQAIIATRPNVTEKDIILKLQSILKYAPDRKGAGGRK